MVTQDTPHLQKRAESAESHINPHPIAPPSYLLLDKTSVNGMRPTVRDLIIS